MWKIIKKILKIIYNTFKTCLICFMFVIGLLICMQRFSNNQISLFGYRMFVVMTGSMSPMYNINDILLCHETDPTDLKVGDDITYIGEIGSYNSRLITHRIIKVINNEDGSLSFQTRGIAATVDDPVISSDQVYGKIVTKLKYITKIYALVSKPTGFYLCIFIPLAILIGNEVVVSMLEKLEDKKEAKKNKGN